MGAILFFKRIVHFVTELRTEGDALSDPTYAMNVLHQSLIRNTFARHVTDLHLLDKIEFSQALYHRDET